MSQELEKIKNAREAKGLTQTDVANKLGIGLRQYQNIEAGEFPKYKREHILNLEKILQIPLYASIYEEKHEGGHTAHEREASYTAKRRRIKSDPSTYKTPVFNTKASAGHAIFFNDHPELIMEYVDIPFIGKSDGVIEIVGDSMYPTYISGTRIAVRKLSDKSLVYPNECYYVIDANYEGRVKRVMNSEKEGHVILVSDNKDYPDVERHWNEIVAVCKILCKIIKN